MARSVGDIPLVGRAEQVSVLLAAVRDAASGRPGAVLVTGDAGVGKTRLVTELSTLATAQGCRVLVGHCVDLGGAGVPYLPFAEALGPLLDDGSSPALARWLSGAGPVADDGEVGRLQLFDAVASALDPGDEGGPTVLVLEDLHWADASSRDLLAFLVRRLRAQRLLVVGTVRSDDLHRRHPLRPLLVELSRLPVVERVPVTPFTSSEMAGFLQALTGRNPDPALVERLLGRSEGNAYFAEQLMASEADSSGRSLRGDLPGALADLLLGRVDALSDSARQVVRAAAVAGPRVEHELLARATGLPADELDEALRESTMQNVLRAYGDGYVFRHALSREAVYNDLLPGERARLHARFAGLLAGDASAPGHAAELARHRMASHDVPGALAASVQAAHEAAALLAPAEELEHLERAIQLWGAVEAAAQVAGSDLLALTTAAAQAASRAGLPARATALAADAVSSADEAGTVAQRVWTRRLLASAQLHDERVTEALATADDATAIARAGGEEDGEEAVRAGVVAVRALTALGRYDDALTRTGPLLALARRGGWLDLEADALTSLALLRGALEPGTDTLPLFREALGPARASGALAVELRVTYNVAVTAYESGDVLEARRVLDEAVARAEQTGLSWSEYGLELRVLQVIVRYAAGDLEGSRRLADLAGHRPSEVVLARISAAALLAAVARGDADALDEVSRLDRAWQQDGQIAMVAGGAGAELHRWRGDAGAALATVDRAVAHVTRVWEPWFMGGIWLAAVGLAAAGDLAEHARLTRDADAEQEAVRAADRLLGLARQTAEQGRPRAGRMGPEGRAWLARAEAEWTRARGAADPQAWHVALEAAQESTRGVDGYEPARCRWRLAEALLTAGDRQGAAEQAGLAAATARRLGTRPLLDAVAALVARGRLDTIDPALPRDRVAMPSSLTARELQVLGLLAEGLTNREAGSRLFVSDKTVSVHVSNLLAKLGARSRTEAVTLAHRRGLLPDAVRAAEEVSPPTART